MSEEPWQVLIPARDFSHAKTRLSNALADDARAGLAQRMLEHVLSVLSAHPRMQPTVLTDAASVVEVAERRGVRWRLDRPGERGTGMILRAASAELPAGPLLVLMADLPLLEVADLQALIELSAQHEIVLAPDLLNAGTNLGWWRRPVPALLHFGQVDSLARHERAARQAGIEPGHLRRTGTAFDLDVPGDLERLLRLASS